ncbi:phosphatidylinositide phosphatase sac2 [Plakobranchus ocellatus]|uniref:Phosphatidylinositide phosphatase sac2 n=1 Tax=Plakobranchus ocellatus TaxID=259542 RepID=A0AAV3YJJ0_9GAST|nr:phosphatidylinositide phosphatase sac2 [Plakobranchus ocellatus]
MVVFFCLWARARKQSELASKKTGVIRRSKYIRKRWPSVHLIVEFGLCKKHHFGIKSVEKINQVNEGQGQKSLRGTWNQIKTAAENVKSKKKETKDKEKFEKRILEELLKMFNESEFFYYSEDFDVTTSLQRQNSASYPRDAALWRRADDRFFWNKHMLAELIDLDSALSDHWLLPIIQGYVQMETCLMDFDEDKNAADMSSSGDFSSPGHKLAPLGYNISVISRRSRHRAGTRSRKRGINSDGACANYVETEQIIEFSPHIVAFVQVRGSIPVFWSQSGFKYRPPPRLDRVDVFTRMFAAVWLFYRTGKRCGCSANLDGLVIVLEENEPGIILGNSTNIRAI